MKTLIKDVEAAIRKGKGSYITEKTNIGIDGEHIAFVGDVPEDFVPDKTVNGSGLFAVPGLVNAHTHVYMTCLRGYADDTAFDEWLFKRVSPAEDSLSDDDAYNSSLLGCVEMLKSGTTAFLEMHMFPGMIADAANAVGMRACLSRGLVGEGSNEAGSKRLAQAKGEMEDYSSYTNLSFMLGPHSVYTTDEAFLRIVSSEAKKAGLPVHIHLSETEHEVSECYKNHGMSPVAYLDSIGLFENKTVAAHCVYVSDDDIKILAAKNVSVALCPRSNLKLGNGIAPVAKMLEAGVNLCVGTDSAASNNTLNLFPDMSMTALLHKGTGRNAAIVTAAEVLDMATYNGAAALGLNSGELAAGKNADIVLLDINKPQFIPHHDLISALCYSANGSETDTVFVGGEAVLEHGRLVKANEDSICSRCMGFTDTLR